MRFLLHIVQKHFSLHCTELLFWSFEWRKGRRENWRGMRIFWLNAARKFFIFSTEISSRKIMGSRMREIAETWAVSVERVGGSACWIAQWFQMSKTCQKISSPKVISRVFPHKFLQTYITSVSGCLRFTFKKFVKSLQAQVWSVIFTII